MVLVIIPKEKEKISDSDKLITLDVENVLPISIFGYQKVTVNSVNIFSNSYNLRLLHSCEVKILISFGDKQIIMPS